MVKFNILKFIKTFAMIMMNCFCGMLTDERRLVLFLAGTIVRDAHHCKSPICCQQDLNLSESEPIGCQQDLNMRRIRVQVLLNEVV